MGQSPSAMGRKPSGSKTERLRRRCHGAGLAGGTSPIYLARRPGPGPQARLARLRLPRGRKRGCRSHHVRSETYFHAPPARNRPSPGGSNGIFLSERALARGNFFLSPGDVPRLASLFEVGTSPRVARHGQRSHRGDRIFPRLSWRPQSLGCIERDPSRGILVLRADLLVFLARITTL